MAKKPGVLLYFEVENVLNVLSDEDCGKLFRAILSYAQEHRQPEIPDRLVAVWPLIQYRLDVDDQRYYDQCNDKGYAAYVRWQKERHKEYLSREDWLRLQKNQALEDLKHYSQM